MDDIEDNGRRNVLKTGAALGVALSAPSLIFTRNAWAAEAFRNDPVKAKKVVLGFNVPQTGPYADEGADELKAFKLAVKHLNGEGDGGMLKTFKPSNLKGNGILGKKVMYVTGDTQTKADAARASAKRMIEKDGVIMFTGGSSSADAVAVPVACAGDGHHLHGRPHPFERHDRQGSPPLWLPPLLRCLHVRPGTRLRSSRKEYGKDRTAYHLTADYTWGWTQEESMKNATETQGWKTVAAVRTPLGAGDFSQYITPVLNSGADVLILNHYGKDMVNSLTQAVQFGLRDKSVNGKKFEIVVPLFSRADGAGRRRRDQGHPRHRELGLEARRRRDQGLRQIVRQRVRLAAVAGRRTPATCRPCSTPTRCETAGTFYPPEVIKALEGFKFDGMGNGPTEYRAADHQCFKDVPGGARQARNRANQFDLLDIVKIVPRADVEYPTTSLDGGDLGPYRYRPRAAAAPAVALAAGSLARRARGSDRFRSGAGHTGPMDAILLQLLNGLDKGGAYALIALGLTLVFGTLGVVNFAHGALFMLGAFCAVRSQNAADIFEPGEGRERHLLRRVQGSAVSEALVRRLRRDG